MALGGDIASQALSWGMNLIVWAVIGVLFLGIAFGFLIYKRNKKFSIPILIRTNIGNGKVSYIQSRAGWFKSTTTFFGLIDVKGEDVCRTKDKRVIQDASSEDYHEINGKMGLLLQRKSDDNKVLVPIAKSVLDADGKKEINSIAPADFRDASNKIIASAEKETSGFLDKYLPFISLTVVAMCFLIGIIVFTQMISKGQASAENFYLKAMALAPTCKAAIVTPSTIAPALLLMKRKWIEG